MTDLTKAHARYRTVVEAAEKKRNKAIEKFQAEYHKVIEPAQKKHLVVRNKAMRIYDAVRDPAWRKYEETVAPTAKIYKDAREAAGAVRDRKKREAQRACSLIRRKALEEYERLQRAARERTKETNA